MWNKIFRPHNPVSTALTHQGNFLEAGLKGRMADGVVSRMDMQQAAQLLQTRQAAFDSATNPWQRRHAAQELNEAKQLYSQVGGQLAQQHPWTTGMENLKDTGRLGMGGGWSPFFAPMFPPAFGWF